MSHHSQNGFLTQHTGLRATVSGKMIKKVIIKSKIQGIGQEIIADSLLRGIKHFTDHEKDVSLHDMLNLCNPYVNEFYDGDPPIAMGTAVQLLQKRYFRYCSHSSFHLYAWALLIAAVSDSLQEGSTTISLSSI